MKILSIDTASNVCGVSILNNDELLFTLDTNTSRTHSENLMPMIQKIFNKTCLTLGDIDLIACDIGPGSFTGIRIGIATIKAFHDSLDIPCIGISSLESLAYNVKNSQNKYICSIIDCKNDNCYFALYENKNNILETLIEPQTDNVIDILSILKNYCADTLENSLITFVGDGSEFHKDTILHFFENANFANHNLNNLNSYSLGLCGFDKYCSGFNNEEILPLYLKKPQAQKQLEEKQKKD